MSLSQLRALIKPIINRAAGEIATIMANHVLQQATGDAAKVKVARPPRVCRVPDCGQPSKGPRYDFFCQEHRKLSKTKKAEIKAAAND